MFARYFGLILLTWFPGVLGAQSAAEPCRPPRLVGGYFVPEQESYSHETKLTYACDEGRKPAVEGWWATSTCQNGIWSPEPRCIVNRPRARRGASAEVDTYGDHGTSAGRGTQPGGGGSRPEVDTAGTHSTSAGHGTQPGGGVNIPGAGHGASAEVDTDGAHGTSAGRGTQPGGGVNRSRAGHGASADVDTAGTHSTSAKRGTQHGGGGSSATSHNGPVLMPAQSAAEPCRPPRLVGGYFVPEQESYSHETKLTYACDEGRKPAVEGWWATSTCQNGIWSPEPQCIDEKACFPPTVPNGNYTENTNGWYEEGDTIRITCDAGYEHKDRVTTDRCVNGAWPSLPMCEKSDNTCSEPPKLPHAVIVNKGYQEEFAVDSEVQYECEGGYTMEGTHTKKSVFCMAGSWTEVPTCSRSIGTGQGAGRGGSAEAGTGGGQTSSAGRGTQPGGGVSKPGAGRGGSAEVGTAGTHSTSAGRETQPGVGGSRPEVGTAGTHSTSAGRGTQPGGGGSRPEVDTAGTHSTWGTQPGGGGSSATSDNRPVLMPVSHCGTHPLVPNGVVLVVDRMYLKYKCNAFYTQVGSDTVTCYSDGTWSQLPVCREAFCVMKPAYYHYGFELKVNEFIKEGEKKYLPCSWRDYSVAAQCTNGRITYTDCCLSYDHYRNICRVLGQLQSAE